VTNLVVWETMQEAALVHMLYVQDNVAVSSAARGSDTVLVEGKRNEYDDGDEIYGGAYGAHALGQEGPGGFAHVATAEAGRDKVGAEPADHGEARGEGDNGQGQGGNEGLAIAVEGVEEDGEGGAGEGDESEGLGSREVVGGGRGHDGGGARGGRSACVLGRQMSEKREGSDVC
jgi:hypothetical protein